jgi:hypothetical protein
MTKKGRALIESTSSHPQFSWSRSVVLTLRRLAPQNTMAVEIHGGDNWDRGAVHSALKPVILFKLVRCTGPFATNVTSGESVKH